MSFVYLPFTLSALGGVGIGGGLITVGDSGVYPTINDALAADQNVLFVNSYTEETEDVIVPTSGLYVTVLPGGTVNMGNNKFSMDNGKLFINGQGSLNYNHTSPNILFDGNDNSKLKVEGIEIKNNSQNFSYLTDVDFAKFSEISFDGNLNVLAKKNMLSDCTFANGNLTFAQQAENNIIDGAIFDGILIIDSGNGTVISDGVVI